MGVCEWPHLSHMQLYAFRDQSDSQIRKEFEKVKEERFVFEKAGVWAVTKELEDCTRTGSCNCKAVSGAGTILWNFSAKQR